MATTYEKVRNYAGQISWDRNSKLQNEIGKRIQRKTKSIVQIASGYQTSASFNIGNQVL